MTTRHPSPSTPEPTVPQSPSWIAYEDLGEATELTRNGKATATEANRGKGR